MKDQSIDEQVRNELSKEGLDEKHAAKEALYLTYASGSKDISVNAMAVYDDGVIYRYSNSIYKFEDGKMLREDVPLKWRVEGQLKEEAVKKIGELLEEFTISESISKSSQRPLEVKFIRDGVKMSIFVEGEESEENYSVFSKINNVISLGTVSKE